jgi:hypothetical protein
MSGESPKRDDLTGEWRVLIDPGQPPAPDESPAFDEPKEVLPGVDPCNQTIEVPAANFAERGKRGSTDDVRRLSDKINASRSAK